MALTTEEEARIRYYLGYSVFEDNGPVQRALSSLAARPEAETILRRDLERLEKLDDAIADLVPIALAVQDGAIQLRGHYSLGVIRSMGRQAVGRLSVTLAVEIKRDVFAEGGTGTIESGDPNGPNRADPMAGGCGC